MKRIAYYTATGSAAVLLVLAAAAGWLLGTSSGARWALDQASRLSPVTIQTEAVEGRIWGDLRIRGLNITWPDGEASIRDLKVGWQPLKLLVGQIGMSELIVAGAIIHDTGQETKTADSPGFALPAENNDSPDLDIRIRSLKLDDITYRKQKNQPIIINSAQTDFSLVNGTVSLKALSLQMPQIRIKGRAIIGLKRLSVDMDATMILPEPVAGMDEFSVKADLAPAEAPARMKGEVRTAGFSASKKMIELESRITITDESLLAEEARISRPGSRGHIAGRGEFMFAAEDPVINAKLLMNNLDLSKEFSFLSSMNGELSFKGSMRKYEGSVLVSNKGSGWKEASLQAGFSGTSEYIALTPLKGNWLKGTLRGSARASWKGPLSLNASLRARGLQPSEIAPEWSGSINTDLEVRAVLPEKKQPRATLSLKVPESSFRGQPLTGRIQASLRQGSVNVEQLLFRGKGFNVQASGELAKRINFSISLADLALFKTGSEGSAEAQGWIRKSNGSLSGSVTGRGRDLFMEGIKAASAEISASVEDRKDNPFSVSVSARDGRYKSLQMDSLILEASGTMAFHRIGLSLRSSDYSINAEAEGAYREGTWNGTINTIAGTDPAGSWKTAESASLLVSTDRISLSPLVLTGTNSERIDLEGTIAQKPLSGSFSLKWHELDISRANAWLTDLKLTGFANGRISGTIMTESRLDISGSASLSRGSLVRRIEDVELKADLSKVILAVTWRDQTIDANLSVVMKEYGQLEAKIQVPVPAKLPVMPNREGRLNVSVKGLVREIGTLSFLFPGLVHESRGKLEMDIRVDGTWMSPVIKGSLLLRNAGAYFPAAGIRVTDIILGARMTENTIRIVLVNARSGKGRLQGRATITLEGWRPVHYEGILQGEQFQALFLPQLRIALSPDITFSGTPRKHSVTGLIRVPEMMIYGQPRDESAVEPSEDVVIVGAEPEEKKDRARAATEIELNVVLGDRVIVKTEGVDARLGGQVLVISRGDEVTGRGEIKVVKGKYSVYGVSLEIERGRLFFAGGPVRNPTLDILALRIADTVRAGVLISGTLQKPIIKLYSEPAMPDADVLAYIVLGHPLGQDREQATLLMQAAGALLSAGESVALQDQIRNSLGIDTIDIEAGSGDVSRSLVTIGKYLSSRLYISYGYALFSGESLFRMRYKFAKHWELESRSGETSGVDLYYTIQFD